MSTCQIKGLIVCVHACSSRSGFIWVPLCAHGNRRQLCIILWNMAYPPPVREILSLPWNSQIRWDWLASKSQGSPVSASLLLWFQVCATTPGIFMWVLGTWTQVLMFIRYTVYWMSHPPRPQILISETHLEYKEAGSFKKCSKIQGQENTRLA